ncbi:hypothetical protein TNCV_3617911 [Trichonephila clavipes]|nr:hypothetical protein TNCV_3617911 [Trichonephila clavipes]
MLRVRPQPKSVEFRDAEISISYDYMTCECPFVFGALGKIKFLSTISLRQSPLVSPIGCRTKSDTTPGNALGLQCSYVNPTPLAHADASRDVLQGEVHHNSNGVGFLRVNEIMHLVRHEDEQKQQRTHNWS